MHIFNLIRRFSFFCRYSKNLFGTMMFTHNEKNFSSLVSFSTSFADYRQNAYNPTLPQLRKYACNDSIDLNFYEQLVDETLESLNIYLEELFEKEDMFKDADIILSYGVLTIKLGSMGTYVINKQTPNRQIWLSSPFSGPKRYDFIEGTWINSKDSTTLHSLLNNEFTKLGCKVDFSKCSYGKKEEK